MQVAGRVTSLDAEINGLEADELGEAIERILKMYGRSGSGRASALRLIGAFVIFQTEGPAGFRKRGFSRMSIQLYRDKLNDAGVRIR